LTESVLAESPHQNHKIRYPLWNNGSSLTGFLELRSLRRETETKSDIH